MSQALKAYPQDVEVIKQQGNLYSAFKKYHRALAWFHEIVIKKPRVDPLHRLIALIGAGAARRNLRDFAEAAKTFQEALDACGGTPSGELLLEQGWLCFYQKSYNEGLTRFQEAEKKLTDDEQHRARVGLLASRR